MGENSSIEWTDHTFNPWIGCTKIPDANGSACDGCYAADHAKRYGLKVWGQDAGRNVTSDANWRQPKKWNRKAERDGVRRRVFCASLADVFEDRRDLDMYRQELWDLVEETPWLDWMLLTKRPECVRSMVPPRWLTGAWPAHAWLGATVEDQKRAQLRIPHLLKAPAPIHFLSCEPMLGAIDLTTIVMPDGDELGDSLFAHGPGFGIDLVIGGGESGPKARPSNPDWFRSLRDQCIAAGAAFHFKQWGEWCPEDQLPEESWSALDRSEDGLPFVAERGDPVRVGKKLAGRHLDERTWDEMPSTPIANRAPSALTR